MLLTKEYRKRILEKREGEQKKRKGWLAVDLHVHSSCSHDVLPSPEFHPEVLYQKSFQLGFDFVTITDHDTMDAYNVIGWERERLVTGVEISLFDPLRVGHTIHVNVYTLNVSQFHELKRIASCDRNIETFIEYLNDQDLPYIYNHPFWFMQHDRPNYRAVEEIFGLFPVIEYNMKRVRKKNLLALGLAAKYQKGFTASTDTHIGKIGQAYTLAQGNSFREFFSNISQGNSYIVPQDLNLNTLNHEIATWIEVLFHLDSRKNEKTRYTGIKTVDQCINFFACNSPEDYPRMFPMIESFLYELAKTGIFTQLYLRSQDRLAYKIGKLLEIPDVV